MNRYLVLIGNVIDGVEFFGPFDTHEDALEYASRHHGGAEWHIGTLNEPVTDEEFDG